MINYSKIVYSGLKIQEYCDKYNISYKYIKYKLNSFKNQKEKRFPIDIQIQIAINNYKKRNKYKDINYKNLKLIDYCKSNNIKYSRIAYRCKYFVKKYNNLALLSEKQIDMFIDDYYKKEEINKLKSTFNKLENCSKNEYKTICKDLNINYEKLYGLKKYFDINIKSLIYICWYSSDKQNNKGIYISKKRMMEIFNKNNLQINDLYGLYKSGKTEILDDILEHEKYYIIGFVLRTIKEYNFKIYKHDYDDLFNEAKVILIYCLSHNVYNNIGKIIRYTEKSVTKQILKYLIKNYSNRDIEFNDNKKIKHLLKEQWEYSN